MCCNTKCLSKQKLSIVFLTFYFTCLSSFNIEERIPLIKQGQKNSLFGLSVAQHYISANPNSIKDVVLLVGAPRSNVSALSKTGAFYRCDISVETHCQQVFVEQEKSTLEQVYSHQWLGVTVESQKPGGKVAVCDHRYMNRRINSREIVLWEQLAGCCYVLDSNMTSSSETSYSPCDTLSNVDGSYTEAFYAYCQAGTSFSFAQNTQEEIAFGTPGIFRWTGGFSTNAMNPTDFFQDNTLWSQKGSGGKISQYSYSGYSIAIGNISEFSFVSGAPRAFDNGAVIIYNKNHTDEINLQIKQILVGDRFASSFGYSLKIFDITGDGYDDLIVSAPQYYDKENNRGGAVYIYVNKRSGQIGPKATAIVFGEVDSFFGISIANLGDINMDGVNDLAVGAPNSDNGIGKVYIFHGSSDPNHGILKHPMQILKGADLFESHNLNVSGFGYAVSGNLDMDLNGYPDLSVGSLSDVAILYRTRPILNVIAFVNASTTKVDINASSPENPNVISFFDKKSNTTHDIVSFNVSICMKYSSIPATFNKKVDIIYNVMLDEKRLKNGLLSRASFVPLSHENGTRISVMKLYKQADNHLKCQTFPIYLNKNMQDKLSPFVLSFSYDILHKKTPEHVGNTLTPVNRYPILNKNIPNMNHTQINISKNCGDDEICQSNLTMIAEYAVLIDKTWKPLSDSYNDIPLLRFGTEKGIGIKVKIENKSPGEDAHQAKLKVQLPQIFNFIDFVPESQSAKTVSCKGTTQNKTSLVICSLGNPFRTNNALSLVLKLEKDKNILSKNQVTVNMTVWTSSKQGGLEFKPYPLALQFLADLNIKGYSIDEQMPFSGDVVGESAVTTTSEAGLDVIHSYEVKNEGTIQVNQVFVTINWPYAISNGKWLFYLLSANVTGLDATNQSQCDIPSTYEDPLKIGKTDKFKSLRTKRDVNREPSGSHVHTYQEKLKSLNVALRCPKTAKCISFNCTIGSIMSKRTVFIYVKGVVWNSTFLEEYNGTTIVKVYSSASVHVGLSNVVYTNSSVRRVYVPTTMLSKNVIVVKKPVDIWIIIVSTFAGMTLLVLIVLGLWKCGFFRRRRDFGDYHKAHKHQQASKKIDELSDRLVY